MRQQSVFTKLLEYWISIPRSLRTGLLTVLTIGILFLFLGKGISNFLGIFSNSSSLSQSMFVIILIASAIIFWVIRKNQKH